MATCALKMALKAPGQVSFRFLGCEWGLPIMACGGYPVSVLGCELSMYAALSGGKSNGSSYSRAVLSGLGIDMFSLLGTGSCGTCIALANTCLGSKMVANN